MNGRDLAWRLLRRSVGSDDVCQPAMLCSAQNLRLQLKSSRLALPCFAQPKNTHEVEVEFDSHEVEWSAVEVESALGPGGNELVDLFTEI